MKNKFNIIVVGGGHAGIEAALTSSKMKCSTLLITMNKKKIGILSCNPSIGGIGKGHLVKEIDALGGIIAKITDNSGIHFKTLNASKGYAVRATRVQVDRNIYIKNIRKKLKKQKKLTIIEGTVKELIIKNYSIKGIITEDNIKFFSKSVILTNGTFLNGTIHIGNYNYKAGRFGEKSSILLSEYLKSLSFKIKRLKTGTPPRIKKESINFNKLEIQNSDLPIPYLSFYNDKIQKIKQVPCYITKTNEKTHEIIKKNIHKSSIYNGNINSPGPRYCPSIEDKIIKFYDKKSHQVYLEPEGIYSKVIYPNGISTSLPADIQLDMVRSIKGLEKSEILCNGYAIEYDFFDPIDLYPNLENKNIKGLFLAGQINGTTGYEEAAAQGLLAGINASLYILNLKSWIPKRSQAYIGVMVDDLCVSGIIEPYRMFTSRAEYRLLLREDNADLRLTKFGRKLGLINDKNWRKYNNKLENIELEKQKFKNTIIFPNHDIEKKLKIKIKEKITVEDLLKRPNITYLQISNLKNVNLKINDKKAAEQVEIQIKYKGYLNRQKKDIKRQLYNERSLIPNNIEYDKISGLSNEVIYKFKKYKPYSIGQASRISGITPAAINILLIYLKKYKRKNIK